MMNVRKNSKRTGKLFRPIILALAFMLILPMAMPQKFGPEPASAATPGITITDIYSESGTGAFGNGISISIDVTAPDGSPITNPMILIKATGTDITFAMTTYITKPEYMVMDPETKTYLENNGFTVAGTDLGSGYTLTRNTAIGTSLKINNLKFFWPREFPTVLEAAVPKGSTHYLQVQNFEFTLKNGASTVDTDTKMFSCTGPGFSKPYPHIPMKGSLDARKNPLMKSSPTSSEQITYDFSFDLKNNINGIDVTTPEQDADGVRYFRVLIQLPGNMMENSSVNYFGNTSLADYGTLGYTFTDSSGWTMVGTPIMYLSGNAVCIEICGKVNDTNPATQEAKFKCAFTFTAKNPKVGSVPTANVYLFRDIETQLEADLAAWEDSTTYRARYRFGGAINVMGSTFRIRAIDDDATKKDFRKEAYSWSGIANNIVDGTGLQYSYLIGGGKEGGGWIYNNGVSNMNGDWIEALFYVDEERGTSTSTWAPGGVSLANWAQRGYDPYYFSATGIQQFTAYGCYYLNENEQRVHFPLTVFVRVKNKETGEYFNPQINGTQTANFAGVDPFTLHGNGNYWPVWTSTSISSAYYGSRYAILNAFGIPSADHDKYVVNGVLWDLSSNGKYGAPYEYEYAIPESFGCDSPWQLDMLALVENPTEADFEKVREASLSDPKFLENDAKIFYFPYVRGEVPIPPVIGDDHAGGKGPKYMDSILRPLISKMVAADPGEIAGSDGWTSGNSINRRYEDKMYWKIRFSNTTLSNANFRSLPDGKVVFYDSWGSAGMRNTLYPSYSVKAYLTGEDYGTALDPAYNDHAGYLARGAIDISSYVTVIKSGDDIIYTVDLMKIPEANRTSTILERFDFSSGKAGLKPGAGIILLFETDLKDPDRDQPRTGQNCNNTVYCASNEALVFPLGTEAAIDYNGNGNKTDDYIHSSAYFITTTRTDNTEVSAIAVNKKLSQKPAASSIAADYDKNKTVEGNDTYSYQLTVASEDAANPLTNIVIEDTLPKAGDSRGSQWTPLVTAAELQAALNTNLKVGNTVQTVVTGTPAAGQWKLETTVVGGYVESFKLIAPANLTLSEQTISLCFDVKVPGGLTQNGIKAVNLMRTTAQAGSTNYNLTSTATAQLRVPQPTPLVVNKYVSDKSRNTSTTWDYASTKEGLVADQTFAYNLRVSAGLGDIPISNLVITDNMPYIGDGKGSLWQAQITAANLLSELNATLQVGYSLQSVKVGAPTATQWGLVTTDSGGFVTSFTLTPPTGFTLSPNTSINAYFNVKVPADMRTDGAIADNKVSVSGVSGSETYTNLTANATAKVKRKNTAEAAVIKEVAPVSDGGAVGVYSANPANQVKGSSVSYKLIAKNTGESKLDNIVINDVLPASGDTFILPPAGARNSEWKLSSFDTSSIDIRLFANDIDVIGTPVSPIGWTINTTQPGGTGGSLQLTAPVNFTMETGERIEITFKAVLPDNPTTGSFSPTVASNGTNSFTFSAKGYENDNDTTGSVITPKEAGVTLGILDDNVGELNVNKAVTGDAQPAASTDFTFTLKKGASTVNNFSYKIGANTFTTTDGTFKLKAGETATILSLEVGTDYSVVETAPSTVSDVTITTSSKADGGTAQNGLTSDPISVGKTIAGSADFTNNYTRDRNELTVTKLVTGNAKPATSTLFTFTLKKGGSTVNNFSYSVDGGPTQNTTNGTFQLKADETATILNLAAGADYTIEETAPALVTDVTIRTSFKVGSAASGTTGLVSSAITLTKTSGGSVEFTNEYAKDTNGLIVTKVLAGDAQPAAGTEFTFTLKKGGSIVNDFEYNIDGGTIETTDDGTFKIKAGEEAIILDLDVGNDYTIEETAPASVNNVTITTGFKVGSAASITQGLASSAITLTYGEPGRVEFTNNYTRDRNDLTVKKVVTGDAQPAAGTDFTFTLKKGGSTVNNFSYEIGGTGGSTTDGTFKLKAGETATILNLLADSDYTVEETAPALVTDVTITSGFKVGNAASITNGLVSSAITLTKTSKGSVEFTNDYTRDRNELTVTKLVTGNAKPAASTLFTFTLKNGGSTVSNFSYSIDGGPTQNTTNGTFQLKADETATILNLAAGAYYTVEETAPALVTDVTIRTSFKVGSAASGTTGLVSSAITLTKTSGGSVEFTNDYDKDTNGLIVTKVLTGDAQPAAGTEFTFTLKKGGSIVNDFDYNIDGGTIETTNDGTFKFKAGEEAVILDLDVGNDYTIEETAPASVNNVTITTGFKVGSAASITQGLASGAITVTYGEPGRVEFTNNYTRDRNDLTVKKVVTGDAQPPAGTDFTFTLKKGGSTVNNFSYEIDGGATQSTTDGTFKLKAGETATILNLLADSDYTVEETAPALVTDVTITSGFKVGNAASITNGLVSSAITLTKTSGGSVEFTNDYAKDTNGLIVTKVLTGDAQPVAGTEFTFTLKKGGSIVNDFDYNIDGGAIETTNDGTFKIKAGEEATILDLDVGNDYTIEETAPASVNNVTITTSHKVGSAASGTTGLVSGAISVTYSTPGSVEFTNNYTRDRNDLTVKKVVTGDAPPAADTEFTFTLKKGGSTVNDFSYEIDGGAAGTATDGTFKLKDGETATILNLLADSDYTVVETTPAGIRNVGVTTSSKVGTGADKAGVTSENITLTKTSIGSVVFTNNYVALEEIPDLTKTAAKSKLSKVGDELTFKVSFTLPKDATGYDSLMIVDDLPAALTFMDSGSEAMIVGTPEIPLTVNHNDGRVTVLINKGEIAANEGSEVILTIKTKVNSNWDGKDIENTAKLFATADGSEAIDPDTDEPIAEASVVIIPNRDTPPLSIVKKADKKTIGPNQELSYTISVTNKGDVAAKNITVKDYLPQYTGYVSSNPAGKLSKENGKDCVTWTISSLAAGKTAKFNLTVKTAASIPSGYVFKNVATYVDSTGQSQSSNTVTTTPTKGYPKTGDRANGGLLALIAAAAALLATVAAIPAFRKRRHQH